ncbi:MAG: hypothetical protein MZU95_07440 [Desulfomicrobium escambiense]|nr:hypothetical protein [Desulfomicrobium escambiense]
MLRLNRRLQTESTAHTRRGGQARRHGRAHPRAPARGASVRGRRHPGRTGAAPALRAAPPAASGGQRRRSLALPGRRRRLPRVLSVRLADRAARVRLVRPAGGAGLRSAVRAAGRRMTTRWPTCCPTRPTSRPTSSGRWPGRGARALRAATGAALRERLLAGNVGAGWQARLEAVYRVTDDLAHRPRRIESCGLVASPADLGLSLWHVAADGRRFARSARSTGRRWRWPATAPTSRASCATSAVRGVARGAR